MYDEIAQEFSKTRGYVWPCVKRFLNENRSKNSKVLEAGCGNGRNLIYAKDLGYSSVEGFDICPNLVDICQSRGLDVRLGNILEPIENKYDIILSIAVIHHLDTDEKRRQAIQLLIDAMKPGASLILTFWSYEKGESKIQKDFVLGDNIVPWKTRDGMSVVSNRYYYVYNEELLRKMLGHFSIQYEIYWEEQNWIVIIKN